MTIDYELHTPGTPIADDSFSEHITSYNDPIDLSTGSIICDITGGQYIVERYTQTHVYIRNCLTGLPRMEPLSTLHVYYREGS